MNTNACRTRPFPRPVPSVVHGATRRILHVVACAVVVLSAAALQPHVARCGQTAYDILVPEDSFMETGGWERALSGAVRVYRNRISVRDGDRCLFLPTCSSFYLQAVQRYGPLWGTLMLLDRFLYRENRWSLGSYPGTGAIGHGSGTPAWYDGDAGDRKYDPVHRNFILRPEEYVRPDGCLRPGGYVQ